MRNSRDTVPVWYVEGVMDNRRMADMSRFHSSVIGAIVSGSSEAVVPVSTIRTEEGLLGIYDLKGQREIGTIMFDARELLTITGRIMERLDKLKDILIFPEDIVLNEKVIFLEEETGEIRFLIIPFHGKTSEKENVASLMERLKVTTDEKGADYLEIFRQEYLKRNYSIYGLLALLEDMKREAGS